MNIDEAIKYLYSFIDYEKDRSATYNSVNYNLQRTKHLLDYLGYTPSLKIIHIAGTKGKGSTANFTVSMLKSLREKTGLFSSPHLLSIRERIKIDDIPISEKDFISLVSECVSYTEKTKEKPTMFEILTAMAFVYFERQNASYAVIETGMGGRLDSTNVATPIVSVITSISYDHMKELGHTLEKIASEKAGIIKKNIPVISGIQVPEVENVLREKASQMGVPFYILGKDFCINNFSQTIEGISFTYEGKNNLSCQSRMLGDFQAENISVAIKTIENAGFSVEENACLLQEAIKNTQIKGRLEVISKSPPLFLDGAHNAFSLKKAIMAVKNICPSLEVKCIFAPLVDKDIKGMARVLKEEDVVVILSKPHSYRKTNIEEVSAILSNMGVYHEIEPDFAKAMKQLKDDTTKNARIILGSLYAVSTYYEIEKDKR